eukprot:1141888-Pelagomonas_calceolata.AAC.2
MVATPEDVACQAALRSSPSLEGTGTPEMLDQDVARNCDQDFRATPPKPSNSVRLGSVWGSKQVRCCPGLWSV